MKYEAVKKHVIELMDKKLNNKLFYHSIEHTLDVIQSADRIAKMEKLPEDEVVLIKTAALFHDLGFINTYDGHEQESIHLAGKILPTFNYSDEEIKKIEGMIKATEMPQNPNTLSEKVLADADLDYLGRDDLFFIGQKLHREWRIRGMIQSLKEWHTQQLKFLINHKYFTESAKKLRNQKKKENIEELKSLLCSKN